MLEEDKEQTPSPLPEEKERLFYDLGAVKEDYFSFEHAIIRR